MHIDQPDGAPLDERYEPTRGPRTDTSAASLFQRDLYLYWRAARETGGLALDARGYLTPAALGRLRLTGALATAGEADQARHEVDDLRRFFVRRLLQRLGLLCEDEQRGLVAAGASNTARFLALSLAEHLRLCVRLWVAGGWWTDQPDRHLALPRMLAPAPPRTALTRRQIVQSLLDSSAGAVHPTPLAPPAPRQITVAAPDETFMRVGREHSKRRRSTSRASDSDDPGAAAILGPLNWLGLTAPLPDHVSRGGTKSYVITPAIAALRAPDASLEETAGKVVVQANFDIIAFPPLTARTLFLLDTCAEPRGSGEAATYRLTRAAFAKAQRATWKQDDVRTQLERLTGSPLPQNVRVTLADWERQLHRLQLHSGAVILELDEPTLLDRLLSDPQAAVWITRRLTPRAALLDERHVEAVRTWLLRHGELPAVHHGENVPPASHAD